MLRGFYRFRQSGKASNNLFIMPLCMNSKEGKIALMNEEKDYQIAFFVRKPNHYKKEFSSSQLSAISSVAILNDTQRDALEYVITRSAQDSKTVASTLLARVKRLGYSENDLKRLVSYLWPLSILKEVDASPTNSGKSDSSLGVGSLSWQFSLIVKCDCKGEMGHVKSSCFFKKRLSIDFYSKMKTTGSGFSFPKERTIFALLVPNRCANVAGFSLQSLSLQYLISQMVGVTRKEWIESLIGCASRLHQEFSVVTVAFMFPRQNQ